MSGFNHNNDPYKKNWWFERFSHHKWGYGMGRSGVIMGYIIIYIYIKCILHIICLRCGEEFGENNHKQTHRLKMLLSLGKHLL